MSLQAAAGFASSFRAGSASQNVTNKRRWTQEST